jgi:Ca2+-binding EF-hand superfamily protein
MDDEKPSNRGAPSDTVPEYRTKDLAAVFEAYCCFGQTSGSGSTLDSSQMNKLAKESGLLSVVPAAEIDVLFSKVKTSGARRIDFDQFRALLGLLSNASSDYCKLVDQIVEAGFPVINATVT